MKIFMKIILLNEWTINKIRAAQVINNYYDLVKELVENSIDAKSKNINIYFNIKNNEIRIIDDGMAMTKENLLLSIEAHATSKFISLDSINHLGFRGEGLHTIKECGNLVIASKPIHEEIGYLLEKNSNNEFITKPTCINPGTEVLVTHIFENIPGKSKFISKKKDFLNIVLFLQRISLAFPEIRFNLFKNNKHYLLLHSSSYDDLIYQIFKISEFNEFNIIKYLEDNEKIHIKIFLNSHLKENKGNILFYVNNRPVDDFGILNILKNILLEKHGHSTIDFLLFFLYIPYQYVDCNITPSKNKVSISILPILQNMLDEFFTSKYISKKHSILHENQFSINYLSNWFNYKNKYIICEFNEEIYFVDTHAISERLLLEKIKNLDYNIQILLEEITVCLTEEEIILFQENENNLSKFKFKYELLGPYLLIYEIPDFLESNEVPKIIKNLIKNKDIHIFLHKLANISCKNSIKAGEKINEKEILEFLTLIKENCNLHSCCHGRDTFKKFNMKDFDKMFYR